MDDKEIESFPKATNMNGMLNKLNMYVVINN